MIKLTKGVVLYVAIFCAFSSLIWGLILQDQRWFSRMALSAAMFAAYGIMIRLDEILKSSQK